MMNKFIQKTLLLLCLLVPAACSNNGGDEGYPRATSPEVIFDKPLYPATTAFINKIRGINFQLTSRDCDWPGIMNAIDAFCMKYAIGGGANERVKSIVKDMVTKILPMDGEIALHVDYSEKKNKVYITFYQKDKKEELLSGEDAMAVFDECVKPYCLTIHDDPDGGNRLLRLKINA